MAQTYDTDANGALDKREVAKAKNFVGQLLRQGL